MARRRPAGLTALFARQARTMTTLARRVTTHATREAVATAARQARRLAEARRTEKPAGDWLPGVAMAPGGVLRFHLHRPPGAAAGERLPLVVMLHGCGQDAADFAHGTRMNALADRERCLVLWPQQDRLANAQACWNWFDGRGGRAGREVALVLAAIDQVVRLYRADPARIAVVGLSAGAALAALVAAEAPDRVAAVVMHAGIAPGAAQSSAQAVAAMHGKRPPRGLAAPLPPLLVIQGGADTVVHPATGRAAAQAWAQALGAEPLAPRDVQRGQRRPLRLTDWRAGGEVVVTLAEVEGLGHAWSGGSSRGSFTDPQGPDATRLAWRFIARCFGRATG